MSTAAKIIALFVIILMLNLVFLAVVLTEHDLPEKRVGGSLLQFLIGSFFVAQVGTSFIERKWYGTLRNYDADRFYRTWVATNCWMTVCGLGFCLWALDTARLIRLGL